MVKVLIKGAGDLASGVGLAFHRAGFQVLMTEIEKPTVIRRTVAFANVIFEGNTNIEGSEGILVLEDTYQDALNRGKIGVMVDPEATILAQYQPMVVVDGILAKKNLGTRITDAPIVIGLGPGFEAGKDCHRVVETKRGHNLGVVLHSGKAMENTGIPGIVEGRGLERVLYSPGSGIVQPIVDIGAILEEGDLICNVSGIPVYSPFKGVLRGLIAPGMEVPLGMKIGDVDPRLETSYCFTVSEKARAIGRAAVEAALEMGRKRKWFGVTLDER